MNNFAGRDVRSMDPHAKTFIGAKVGAVCLAPPVHDCGYIRVRNQLAHEAMRTAYEQSREIKAEAERENAVLRIYQTEMRRLVTEYYREHR